MFKRVISEYKRVHLGVFIIDLNYNLTQYNQLLWITKSCRFTIIAQELKRMAKPI